MRSGRGNWADREVMVAGQQRGSESGAGADGGAPRWLAAVARRLERLRGRAVVVAVSGGGDSVALLRAVDALAPGAGLGPVVVAHLDHGARGAESDADAAFVEALAAALGRPCERGRWRPERPGRFETEARRARLSWLAGVAAGHGAAAVLLGHTRDDQAETILHRIVRGTGPRGLAGMPARRPLAPGIELIRPLLRVGRAPLRAYLRALEQPWREDATNADRRQTRARIRHELLPRLVADFNPRAVEALVRLGALAGDLERRQDRRLARLVRAAHREPGPAAAPGALVLDLARIAPLAPTERTAALRLAWRDAGLPERAMTARHWHRLATLAGPRGQHASLALPGATATRLADALRIGPTAGSATPVPPARPDPVPLPCPGAVAWGAGGLTVEWAGPADPGPGDRGRDPAGVPSEWIDAGALEPFGSLEAPHLLVRSAVAGDRFAPLGLAGHSQPLADFFRGRRVPAADRPAVPLVCDRLGIVWVAGHRIAERVKVVPGTGARWRLAWNPGAPGAAAVAVDRPGTRP